LGAQLAPIRDHWAGVSAATAVVRVGRLVHAAGAAERWAGRRASRAASVAVRPRDAEGGSPATSVAAAAAVGGGGEIRLAARARIAIGVARAAGADRAAAVRTANVRRVRETARGAGGRGATRRRAGERHAVRPAKLGRASAARGAVLRPRGVAGALAPICAAVVLPDGRRVGSRAAVRWPDRDGARLGRRVSASIVGGGAEWNAAASREREGRREEHERNERALSHWASEGRVRSKRAAAGKLRLSPSVLCVRIRP
jgi:hypothetical protein